MADHSADDGKGGHMDISAHRETYGGFIKGSVVLTLVSLMICISLVMFRFGHSWSVFLGFAGLLIGIIAVLIDLRAGSGKWTLSAGWAVLFGLMTAMNVG